MFFYSDCRKWKWILLFHCKIIFQQIHRQPMYVYNFSFCSESTWLKWDILGVVHCWYSLFKTFVLDCILAYRKTQILLYIQTGYLFFCWQCLNLELCIKMLIENKAINLLKICLNYQGIFSRCVVKKKSL